LGRYPLSKERQQRKGVVVVSGVEYGPPMVPWSQVGEKPEDGEFGAIRVKDYGFSKVLLEVVFAPLREFHGILTDSFY
jgi:hypothetical protein